MAARAGTASAGLARLSKRSLVAVLTFMAAAFAAAFVMNHVSVSP
jgi:uncharacterized membrane protein YedE/YeeE